MKNYDFFSFVRDIFTCMRIQKSNFGCNTYEKKYYYYYYYYFMLSCGIEL